MITATQWNRSGLKGDCCAVGQLKNFDGKRTEAKIPDSVNKILKQYIDVFQEPKRLPPSRPQDHRIPLLAGTNPVNIRPYRYTYEQKNEIERQIQEMLKTIIIQPSTSLYASPVLLVKKNDNS